MQFTQHILVPTDFSPAAEPALEAARVLAVQNTARVTIAHVFETRPPFTAAPTQGSEEESDYERELREGVVAKLREVGQRLADVPDTKVAVVNGQNPALGICEFARTENVDLIVMGTHGRSGLVRFLIGSVTEKVVRHAPCRVLVLRTGAPPQP